MPPLDILVHDCSERDAGKTSHSSLGFDDVTSEVQGGWLCFLKIFCAGGIPECPKSQFVSAVCVVLCPHENWWLGRAGNKRFGLHGRWNVYLLLLSYKNILTVWINVDKNHEMTPPPPKKKSFSNVLKAMDVSLLNKNIISTSYFSKLFHVSKQWNIFHLLS